CPNPTPRRAGLFSLLSACHPLLSSLIRYGTEVLAAVLRACADATSSPSDSPTRLRTPPPLRSVAESSCPERECAVPSESCALPVSAGLRPHRSSRSSVLSPAPGSTWMIRSGPEPRQEPFPGWCVPPPCPRLSGGWVSLSDTACRRELRLPRRETTAEQRRC